MSIDDEKEAMAEETQKEVTRIQLGMSQTDLSEKMSEWEKHNLTQIETDHLIGVKEANPHFFAAFLKTSEIMPARRRDYSAGHDPYFNFYFMKEQLQLYFGKRIELTNRDVFAFYRILKYARWLVGKQQDSTVDEANYILLDLGDELRGKKE